MWTKLSWKCSVKQTPSIDDSRKQEGTNVILGAKFCLSLQTGMTQRYRRCTARPKRYIRWYRRCTIRPIKVKFRENQQLNSYSIFRVFFLPGSHTCRNISTSQWATFLYPQGKSLDHFISHSMCNQYMQHALQQNIHTTQNAGTLIFHSTYNTDVVIEIGADIHAAH
jgi:hypothetical protein